MNLEEELLKFIKQGKTYGEMATIKGVSERTIQKWISQIDLSKVEIAKNENLKREEEEVLKLTEEGKTNTIIAQLLGKSPTTISKIIKRIDAETYREAKRRGKEAKRKAKKINNENEEHICIKPLTKYEEMNEKLKQATLREKDIISYRGYIEENLNFIQFNEVVLMLNIYIKEGQAIKAVQFINLIINKNNICKFDIEKLQIMKAETEKVQNSQKQRNVERARKLLEKNISVGTVVYYTNLKESEVMKIKQEIDAKKGIEI